MTYLSHEKNRIQQGKINGILSDESDVVLFLIYINDLMFFLSNDECKCICYADDSVILIKNSSSWENLHNIAEHYISLAKLWMYQTQLTSNDNKTLFIYFTYKTVIKSNYIKNSHLWLHIESQCSSQPSVAPQKPRK